MSKDDQDNLIKEVEAAREVKKLGARVTNKSAAQDYRASMEAIDDIVSSTYTTFYILLLTSMKCRSPDLHHVQAQL